MARIIFMGTPEFSVPIAAACSRVGELVAVICQPDRPKGRGNEVAAGPVKQFALEHQIPVWQPVKVKTGELEAQLREAAPDVAVVAAYGRILPKGVLEAPRLGSLNVHASLLPRLRGAAPIQWAIARGERETGVCLMQMDEGLDTGPVLARRSIPLAPEETSGTLHQRLSALGSELVEQELPRFLRGELRPEPQDEGAHTLAPIIDKEHGRIDWSLPAEELERRVRAFDPWPGTYTHLGGKHLKVLRARVAGVAVTGDPGTVRAAAGELEINCGRGVLAITELQLEGRRRMNSKDFLAGNSVQPGRPLG